MLDLNTPLGRDVPTAQQVFEVIRPEMRIMHAFAIGLDLQLRDGDIAHNEDLEPNDGGDEHAIDTVFDALRLSALQNVKSWSLDSRLVFDEHRMQEFIRLALVAANTADLTLPHLPGGTDALRY